MKKQIEQADNIQKTIEVLDMLEYFSKNIFANKLLPPPILSNIADLAAENNTTSVEQDSYNIPDIANDLIPTLDEVVDKDDTIELTDLIAMSTSSAALPTKPATTSAKDNSLPDILAGRYKLERILGVGGMCVVYRAFDILASHYGDPAPYVALKTFTEEFAEYPDANYLLYSEYALTSKLCHPNIINVYQFDVDIESERAFLTLELLKGITLEQWLIENPQGVIWKHAKELVIALLEIITYSHQQGVLHGDLKPSNIMLTDDGLKLFDYGLGQALAGEMVKLPKIARNKFNAWTPRYAAPELIDGALLSEKTDIFALCCIIYEIMTGKNPYFQDNNRTLANTPRRPKTLSKQAWKALLAGLSLEPKKRQITSSQLLGAFNKQSRFVIFN